MSKYKLTLKLEVLDKTFQVVKPYSKATHDEVVEQAKQELNEMLVEGLPEGNNTKCKYLLDEKINEEVK